jgi:LssY-like putative type I secretion system component LssY
MRARRPLLAASGLLLAAAASLPAAELPAGTRLSVRLDQNVYSHAVTNGQPVAAILIAPVRVGADTVVPAGWRLRGTVTESGVLPGREKRARLRFAFAKLVDDGGNAVPVAARLVAVDNARETVDAEGRVLGPPAQKGLPKDKAALLRLGVELDPVALGLIEAGNQTVRSAVGYDRGTEMTVELTAPASIPAVKAAAGPKDLASDAELKKLAAALPASTDRAEPVNLLIAGARGDVEAAFAEAGWTATDRLWAKAGPAAFVALAAKHGFRPAPPSQLGAEAAALSFEKQTNTLAQRHRVRLWARTETLSGKPVWVGSAVRAADLAFDRTAGTYAYKPDAKVDAERDKVVQDLVFAGRVTARGTAVRKDAKGSDGDGRLAAVVLK